jgi:t-SNARE complex subunit (syntaxin)
VFTLPVTVQDDGDLYNTALGDAVSQQRLQAQRVESNARLEAEIAAERREEIRLLEGDIVDLAQVFQECAQLVKDQGEEVQCEFASFRDDAESLHFFCTLNIHLYKKLLLVAH